MRRAVHQSGSAAARRLLFLAVLWASGGALAWSPAALAFGPSGHRVAGHIAERYLCAETRVVLAPLLGGMTLAEAGLWPDSIRRQPEWEHTRPWHFINVTDRGSLAHAARRDKDNVLSALARFETELGDESLANRQRGIALRFVVHFIVDIHQPLHVGRAEDRGGNLISVLVDGRETNLHAVWDAESLRPPGGPGPLDWARSMPWPPAAELSRWRRAGPIDWARESQAIRPQVYGFSRAGEPAVLPADYLARARSTQDRRLLQAGVRLAGRLNAVLGPAGGCAAEVATSHPTL